MSPSPDSPAYTQADAAGEAAAAVDTVSATTTVDSASEMPEIGSAEADDAGRSFGRVRGQRLEITKADLTMYSAITGRAPSREERERALTWSDADPLHERIADRRGTVLTAPMAAALPIQAMRPWHPAALSLRLRDMWFNGLTIRVNRPHLTNWVRRLSSALDLGRVKAKRPR
jgi:hypothetical protein